jgi:hypothetical protein
MTFIRYIDIDEEHFEELIDAAVGYEVDRHSVEYDTMCKKIREWKKNWFSKFIKAASVMQRELETAQSWGSLEFNDLPNAYVKMFSFEHWYTLMSEIHAGTIDWRETLKHEQVHCLYKTIFTFTMV